MLAKVDDSDKETPIVKLRNILGSAIRKALRIDQGALLSKMDMTIYAIIDETTGCDDFFWRRA